MEKRRRLTAADVQGITKALAHSADSFMIARVFVISDTSCAGWWMKEGAVLMS